MKTDVMGVTEGNLLSHTYTVPITNKNTHKYITIILERPVVISESLNLFALSEKLNANKSCSELDILV